jgi:4'-phosphopantetheinyl transferase EntD
MTEPCTPERTLLSTIVPPGIATAEIFGDTQVPSLFPVEAAIVAKAVDKRRHEFNAGRAVARQALGKLGQSAVPIVSGRHREPIWPIGFVGSITHCDGYCAAAVAKSDRFVSIGIDAERHEPLPDSVVSLIASKDELGWINRQTNEDVYWDRLLFSAKESVYKTWFPLTRRWLDFADAHVEFDKRGKTFFAALLEGRLNDAGLSVKGFEGRYLVQTDLVLTAVTVARPDSDPVGPL